MARPGRRSVGQDRRRPPRASAAPPAAPGRPRSSAITAGTLSDCVSASRTVTVPRWQPVEILRRVGAEARRPVLDQAFRVRQARPRRRGRRSAASASSPASAPPASCRRSRRGPPRTGRPSRPRRGSRPTFRRRRRSRPKASARAPSTRSAASDSSEACRSRSMVRRCTGASGCGGDRLLRRGGRASIGKGRRAVGHRARSSPRRRRRR